MPTYCFRCEQCNCVFEISLLMCESHLIEPCPKCNKSNNVCRDYQEEGASLIPPQKTLGSRADKNSKRFSEDQKNHLLGKDDDGRHTG